MRAGEGISIDLVPACKPRGQAPKAMSQEPRAMSQLPSCGYDLEAFDLGVGLDRSDHGEEVTGDGLFLLFLPINFNWVYFAGLSLQYIAFAIINDQSEGLILQVRPATEHILHNQEHTISLDANEL